MKISFELHVLLPQERVGCLIGQLTQREEARAAVRVPQAPFLLNLQPFLCAGEHSSALHTASPSPPKLACCPQVWLKRLLHCQC